MNVSLRQRKLQLLRRSRRSRRTGLFRLENLPGGIGLSALFYKAAITLSGTTTDELFRRVIGDTVWPAFRRMAGACFDGVASTASAFVADITSCRWWTLAFVVLFGVLLALVFLVAWRGIRSLLGRTGRA